MKLIGLKFLVCTCLAFLFLGHQGTSQECSPQNTTFQIGERIDYTIYYHLAGVWVGAGDVYFKVDAATINDRPYYHFSSYGSSYKKYDWIYKVRDTYETYTSVDDFKPLRFKRKVNEGSTHIREDYVFKHALDKVVTLRQMEADEPFVKDTVDLKECSFDVLSMIYYARNIDFSDVALDERVPIRIFIDNESYDSYIRYLGKKEIEIKGLGRFRCIVFSPFLIEGTIFNAGEDMTVWVSDDKNRVPLLIETPILVGSIKARVNTMEGLRYELDSKIED
ncbi:MAG: DUF3108 domain-containing protein [Vicingaceae bacterium]